MKIALEHAGVGVQEIADYLGVTRGTVGKWINGHISPSRQTVLLWAMRTGVPVGWLETGETPTGGPGGGSDGYTARDSNPEPAGYALRPVRRPTAWGRRQPALAAA